MGWFVSKHCSQADEHLRKQYLFGGSLVTYTKDFIHHETTN